MYDQVDTPALLIDVDVLDRNIRKMQDAANRFGVKLRPHTKTHKIPEIAKMQVAAGSDGITVAKLGEADVMADAGLADIFIAYPIVGEIKLRHLISLARRVRVSVALDTIDAARGISDAAKAAGLTIDLRLEIDTGGRRCGVLPGARAAEYGQMIAALPNVRLVGISTHEGHGYFAGEPDAVEQAAVGASELMAQTAAAMRQAGLDVSVVSIGSTPTAPYAGEVHGITEMRPGTYVFNDRSQVLHRTATIGDCAASVLATVVSTPAPDRAVIDAGSKSFSADPTLHQPPMPGNGIVVGAPGWSLARMSEEHGVLLADAGAFRLHLGDRLRIIPNHVCSTVNMFDEVVRVRGQEVIGTWKVAGRGKVR